MKFFVKDVFSKYDQIRSFLRIWSHLLKKNPLMENFIFCVVDIIDKLFLLIRPQVVIKNFYYKKIKSDFFMVLCNT